VTHLRQIMLEELERRNYAPSTIRAYIRTVEHFARHFHRSPDQLGLEHIRQYQAAMFRTWKLAPTPTALASPTAGLSLSPTARSASAGGTPPTPTGSES
jgi:integrase/recombinase XerD